jgi:hypothetical protein
MAVFCYSRQIKCETTSARSREGLPGEVNRAAQHDVVVTLSPTPRSLQELWFEYKFGIDGGKPAEQFTTREKNESRRLKQK